MSKVREKICFTCKQKKPYGDFNKDPYKKDGFEYQCKFCREQRRQKWLKTQNGREFLIRDRIRAKNYYQDNKKRINNRMVKYNKKKISTLEGRLKYNAYQNVYYHKHKGNLIPQPCLICGNNKVEAHHEDYNKPLEVKWLCSQHHREVHFGKTELN